MRKIVIAGVLIFAVCAPAHSAGPHERQPVLGGVVQQEDVELFFDYLRDALTAASEGRAAAPPEALTRRAEEIGEDMKRHGAAAARALVDALESALHEKPRELPRAPSAPAYQRI